MLAAFFVVAAYLGLVGIGSQYMDPPPRPISSRVVPDPARAAVEVASSNDERTARTADR